MIAAQILATSKDIISINNISYRCIVRMNCVTPPKSRSRTTGPRGGYRIHEAILIIGIRKININDTLTYQDKEYKIETIEHLDCNQSLHSIIFA